MNIATLKNAASRLILVGALGGLTLAGCNRAAQNAPPSDMAQAPAPLAALPLSTATAPPLAPAPSADALPRAPRLRVARLADPRDSYAYADRAYALNDAFGDAPPDYTFDYDGVTPWVWRSDNNDERLVEPLADGDRYYYYEPGADTPYLVRDADYAYGFDGPQLVVVYDSAGRALDPDQVERLADHASRYFSRGRSLYGAAHRQQRQAVAAANWAGRRSELEAERARWAAGQQNQSDWRAYHDQHDAEYQTHWGDERYRREAAAARFAQAINDRDMATRDWQAARDARARSTAQGAPAGPGPATGPAPGVGRPQGGQAAPNGFPSQQPPHSPFQQPGAPAAGQPDQTMIRLQQQQATAHQAQVQAQAVGQAQDQARRDAARQAQLQAQTAEAARRAQIQAQAQAAGQAQEQARREAAHQHEAQVQAAEAARQAQLRIQADQQAQIAARTRQQELQQRDAAAHQAQAAAEQARMAAQAQARANLAAQAEAARQAHAQANAAALAQAAQARAQAHAPPAAAPRTSRALNADDKAKAEAAAAAANK